MVISTGMTLPRMDSVWALYALQKSMMLTPCGPSAVPTGGAGVAEPACSCTLTSAAIFFLGGIAFFFLSCGHDEGTCPLPRVVARSLSLVCGRSGNRASRVGFETRRSALRGAQVCADAPQPLR